MKRIEEDDTTGNLQMKVNGKNNRYITAYFFPCPRNIYKTKDK
jgi:hypothetical protein